MTAASGEAGPRRVFHEGPPDERRRPLLHRLVRAGVAAAALFLAFCAVPPKATTARAEGAQPWEGEATAVGSLRFYDAHGDLVTSDSTSASPFADYTQSSIDGGSGDDEGALYAFTPDPNAPSSSWVGELLSGPSAYPNASAPTRVNGAVLPVESGRTGDVSIASFIAQHPNRSSATGYAGLYELRLYTGHAGRQSSSYSATYISVRNGSWSQVYPAADSTTTSVAVLPGSWQPGASISMVVKLTPATVGGTVTFSDGDSVLGTVPDRAIEAFLDGLDLGVGHHTLSALFRPQTSGFRASSASASYDVGVASAPPGSSTGQPTATSLTVNPEGPVDEGTTVTLTATVNPSSAPGSVEFFDGPHVMATVAVDQGEAAYATTSLKASEHHLSATYVPSNGVYQASSSQDVALKVAKRGAPPPTDLQNITVTVPGVRVLGEKIHRGILSRTGVRVAGLVLVGAIAILVGAMLRTAARRRRSRTS
jgi:Bacterial Ig-like domain (group 3)